MKNKPNRHLLFVVLLIYLAVVSAVRSEFTIVRIIGISMEPSYTDGELVLVARHSPVSVGDVVLFERPATINQPSHLAIKRVHAVSLDGLFVVGDNSLASVDSRVYGPISRSSVFGVVIIGFR